MSTKLLHELTLWSGRLAALALVLNFTTCFVMPWARNRLPWRGGRPGRDQKDSYGWFQFTAAHKLFAWLTILLVLVHIIISIMARS
ncbi:MAG: hypothetical protein U0517_01140 [Candidatus Andersenbacteria bacterium]